MSWHHTTGASTHVRVPKPAMPKVTAPKAAKPVQTAKAAPKPAKVVGPKPITAKGKTAVFTEKHRPHMSAVSMPKGIRHG